MQPQPQTLDSSSNEATFDTPNQEYLTTETMISNPIPHSMQTIELAAEPTPHEPLLLQLATLRTPLSTPRDRIQPSLIDKPDNWNQMSASAKQKWRQTQKYK